jgi:hypothetical protein
MFVTNHVLSGVIIGQALPRRPVTALLVGVGSHLILDIFPHWGCDLRGPGGSEQFLALARRDGICGLVAMTAATAMADRTTRTATVAAMAGAVLLDLDKPSLHFLGVNPFPGVVDRFHKWVQNESPEGMSNEMGYGSAFAVVAAGLVARNRRRLSLGAMTLTPLEPQGT